MPSLLYFARLERVGWAGRGGRRVLGGRKGRRTDEVGKVVGLRDTGCEGRWWSCRVQVAHDAL